MVHAPTAIRFQVVALVVSSLLFSIYGRPAALAGEQQASAPRGDEADPFGSSPARSNASDPFAPPPTDDPFGAPSPQPAQPRHAVAPTPSAELCSHGSLLDRSSFSIAERRILAQLRAETTVDYMDVSLSDVLTDISLRYEIPLIIDTRALKHRELSVELPVSLSLARIPLRSGLRLMLAEYGLTYLVADDALIVTTQEGARRPLVRVYRVDQLADGLTVRVLSDLLQELASDDGGKVLPFRNRLVVKHHFEGHQRMMDLLEALGD